MTVASTSWVASGPQQLNRKCPPGLSTRATSAYATGRSGKNMTPNWHATMSALASPNGSFIASACRHVAAGTCADPTSTIATLRSVAVTRASGRLVVKARVSTPVPAASSSTSRGRWRTTRAARSSAYGWKTAGTRYSSYASDMSSAHTRLASLGRGHPASEVRRYKTAPCREASDVWHLGGHQHTTALQFGAWFGYESQTR